MTQRRFRVGDIAVQPRRYRDDGSCYWQATQEADGTRSTVWSGWATREEAEVHVASLLVSTRSRPTAARGTVAALVLGWLQHEVAPAQDLRPRTKQIYANDVNHILEHLGASPLGSGLSLERLNGYRDTRLAAGASTGTVKQEMKRISQAWAWGRRSRLVPDYGLAMPRLRVAATREKHTPTEAHVRLVAARLREDKSPRWVLALLRLLWATGARVSEITKLRWRAIGPEELVLPGKGGRPRPFPRTEAVDAVLAELEEAEPEDFGLAPDYARTRFLYFVGRACKAIDVPRFTPHGIRRAVEDRLADRGVTIKDYADLLGHSPAVALQHYRRSTAATRRRTAAQAALGAL
ncbi:MAG: tyrosine-type recombinase/integrase [Myxococcota bacterium]